MTDIVKRLRFFVPHCEDQDDYLEDELLFLKAADEIERLREALREIVKHSDYDDPVRDMALAALGEKE